MDWVETTGKSIDEATERALAHLGVHRDDAEIEILQLAVEQYRKVVDDGDDAVKVQCASLIDQQGQHDAEIERMRGMVKRAEEQCKKERTDAEAARASLNAANYRMASWSTDKKAVETADHYRIKYEEAMKELGNLKGTYRNAINLAYADAARSKVKREAIRSVESGVESLLRLR